MQTFIDFLVNNYLWFLIISFILIFALIGYLVDTNERKNKEDMLDGEADVARTESIKSNDPIESVNMDMGIKDTLEKDIIKVPISSAESEKKDDEEKDETEILDIE